MAFQSFLLLPFCTYTTKCSACHGGPIWLRRNLRRHDFLLRPSLIPPPDQSRDFSIDTTFLSASADRMLWTTNLTKSHDGCVFQLRNESFNLNRGDKVAILGPNGCGKSTLLSILAGLTNPDTGEVFLRKGSVVAHVAQTLPLQIIRSLTVTNAVLKLASLHAPSAPVRAALRHASAVAIMEDTVSNSAAHRIALTELAAATVDMDQQHDAWQVDSFLSTVLARLELPPNAHLENLSGGQRRRVGIAAAVVSKPNILLLDEVTNHLSIDGIQFLEEFLSDPSLTAVVISHDRAFVDKVCTTAIWELDGQLHRYGPGYASFLAEKTARLSAEERHFEDMRKAMGKELAWLNRQPKARSTKNKARIHYARKLQQTMRDHATRKNGRTNVVTSVNTKGTRLGGDTVALENITLFRGSEVVVRNFNYTFGRDERIGIVGGNGVGKSSFLQAILGELPLDDGHIRVGETVAFGYFDQEGIDLSAPLSEGSVASFGVSKVEDLRVLDYVTELTSLYSGVTGSSGLRMGSSGLSVGESTDVHVAKELQELSHSVSVPPRRKVDRTSGNMLSRMEPIALLNHFGFVREKQHDFIRHLSGGERRRLQLIGLLLKKPNFLVLDEVSNDLDVNTLTMIEEILMDHVGVLILCSHDRFMLDRLVDHLLVFEGGGTVRLVEGKFSDYLQERKEIEQAAKRRRQTEGPTVSQGFNNNTSNKTRNESKKHKLNFKERKEYKQLEADIEKYQKEFDMLSERMTKEGGNANYERVKIWSEQLAWLEKTIDEKTERWMELAELEA